MSFRNLTEKREFRIYVPDPVEEQAKANLPYVLRIELPVPAQWVGVMQIEHPLSAVPGFAGMAPPTIGYAFLVDPDPECTQCPWHITALLPGMPFPWHKDISSYTGNDVQCLILGTSSHAGVPLLHVRTALSVSSEGEIIKFEAELVELGYMIVKSKLYDRSAGLVGLMRQHKEG